MNSSSTKNMGKRAVDDTGQQFFDSWCRAWHDLQTQQLKRYLETMESHMRRQHSAMEEILTQEIIKQFQHMKHFSEECGNGENIPQSFLEAGDSGFEPAHVNMQSLSQQSTAQVASTSFDQITPQQQSAVQAPKARQEPALVAPGQLQIEGASLEDSVAVAAERRNVKKAMKEYRGAIGWKSAGPLKTSGKSVVAHGPVQTFFIRITNNKLFSGAIAFLILSNTIIIGVEANLSMKNILRTKRQDTEWAKILEGVYSFVFLAELLARVMAERSGFFFDGHAAWNIFDVVVVASALAEVGLEMVNLTFMRVLRVFRMLRVLRVIRVFKVFRELRLMVVSIISSALTLTWAFVLMLILIFCFAVCFLQGLVVYIKSRDTVSPDVYEGVKKYFPDMGTAIFTLMAVISGGFEWEEVAELLWEVHPAYMHLFAVYIVFVLFGVLNILTAVFVESAGNIAKVDNELVIQGKMEEHESLMNQLEKLFIELDNDHSGTISWEEFSSHLEDPRMIAYFSEMGMDIHEAEGLYHLLDVHESGQVAIEEFMIGCLRLKGGAKSIDVASLMYDQKKAMLNEKGNFASMGHRLQSMEGHVKILCMHMKHQASILEKLVGNVDLCQVAKVKLVDKGEPKAQTRAYWKSTGAFDGGQDVPSASYSL